MPLSAPVNKHGAKMDYEDSGAPPGSTTYTTLVILHGGYFTNGVFRPMIPYAASNNVRLVLLNARDFGKSTPYSEEEMKAILSKDKATQAAFMGQAAPEYAIFLDWLIRHEEIPPVKTDINGVKTGGIGLFGWSAASDWFIPMIVLAEAIPEDTRVLVGEYLRTYVMYDPTYYTIGKEDPPLEDVYCPLRDPALTSQEQAEAFPAWVSGYYPKHAPVIRAALEANSLDTFPSSSEYYKGIQRNRDETEDLSPTLLRISQETLAEISSMDVFVRSTLPVLFFDKSFYADCAEKLIFDAEHAKKYFPQTTVRLVINMFGQGDCLTCAYAVKEMLLKRQASGMGGRAMDVVPFDGVNHMPHWDFPEKTVKFMASVVQ